MADETPPLLSLPPPPPPLAAHGWRAFFLMNAGPRRRWITALRAGVCMGAPMLLGLAMGNLGAGLMATLGAFTCLYGSGRPYLYRAWLLALVALSFAASVAIGMWAAPIPGAGVLLVALIAMLATLLCNALQVGPPGAYMFALAAAAGTAMPAHGLSPVQAGALILAAGVFCWCVHMAGMLFGLRRPERQAVAAASRAVSAYLDAIGTPQQDSARHAAALALHEAWAALVSYQPRQPPPDGKLSRLRSINRQLQLLFADALGAAGRAQAVPAGAVAQAREIERQLAGPLHTDVVLTAREIPLGRMSAWQAIMASLQPASPQLLVVLRVGMATLVAGTLAAVMGLEHGYWAIATAVLVLHQGFDWLRTLQRGIERTLGTWLGLLLAIGLFSLHPQGVWLVLAVMLLQFIVEMVVVRNYGLAVIFITALALTIATGGRPVADLSGLLLARGIDTSIGCLVALAVYGLMLPGAVSARLPEAMQQTLAAVDEVAVLLAQGELTSPAARQARSRLQHEAFALMRAYEAAVGASKEQRKAAEYQWPAVAATQRVAYRMLSACWELERLGSSAAARAAAAAMLGEQGVERLHAALAGLRAALRMAIAPAPLGALPPLLDEELRALHAALARHRGAS